jgi:hypothetical protein
MQCDGDGWRAHIIYTTEYNGSKHVYESCLNHISRDNKTFQNSETAPRSISLSKNIITSKKLSVPRFKNSFPHPPKMILHKNTL